MRAVLVGIVATTALASCTPTSADSPLDVRRAQVDSLEPTLPALAALEVELFRDQDWCAVLDYARGTFTTNERETCVYFADDPQPFDAQASADFDALKASLQASGVPVRLVRPEFELSSIGVDFTSCTADGLIAAFQHGEAQGRAFLQSWQK